MNLIILNQIGSERMNKKMKTTALAILLLLGSQSLLASTNIGINYSGTKLNLNNQPMIKDDSIFLPIRELSEKFGYTVTYIPKENAVDISNGTDKITLYIDQYTACINGLELYIYAPCPYVANNTTYVPIRFISEAFGLKVDWNQKSKEVSISKSTFVVNKSTKKLISNITDTPTILGDLTISDPNSTDICETKLSDNSYIFRFDSSHGEPAMIFDVNLFYIKNNKVIDKSSYRSWYPRNRVIKCLDNMAAICDGKEARIYDDRTGTLTNTIDLVSLVGDGDYTLDIVGNNFIVVRDVEDEGGGMGILIELNTNKIQKLYELIPDADDRDYAQWGNLPTYDCIRLIEKHRDTLTFSYHNLDNELCTFDYILGK